MPRSRTSYLLATCAVIGAGLLVRHAGLPWPVAKYAGSTLWGAMVYGLVSLARPQTSFIGRISAAGTIALTVELSRLYHTSGLDALRMTMAGALLLGRFFSLWNLVAYGIGIALAALVDRIAGNPALISRGPGLSIESSTMGRGPE